ncbi:hypothetical protein ZIOFF_030025 [Zingiber officinale]|uniref:Nudix hydrolase domain-containing protein n=1 Tax=Zingiber officinale TaxID=94328 RepID=A0A8J5LB24_ZINOF|nr:hypothetical protein ZIOFF_030025 [Zingiber officinale]
MATGNAQPWWSPPSAAAPPPLLIWPSLDKPLPSPSDPPAFVNFAFSSAKSELPSSPSPWKVLPRATEGTWGSASSIPITRFVALRVGSSTLERSSDGWFRVFRSFRLQGSMSPAFGRCLSYPIFYEHLLQGGIEGEENARIAAFRELKEETGVTSADILAEVPYWLTYDFPLEAKAKLNKLWGTDWKGQAQKWFLFRFTGDEDEISLTGDGSEKPEFGEWMWMTPEQVIECAVDFKKSVYEEVLKFFKPHLRPDSADSDSEE